MPNKSNSITFRVSPELDAYLVRLATSQAIDKSKLLNRIIQEYGELKENQQKLLRAEQNLKETKKENKELKKQNAFFESTKLDFLFEELKGKTIEGHPINTKNDLLRFILNSFDYQEGNNEITAIKQQHQVKQNNLNPWGLLLLFLAMIGGITYYFYDKKQRLSKALQPLSSTPFHRVKAA